MAGHEIKNEMEDWRRRTKDGEREIELLKMNTESGGIVVWRTSEESGQKGWDQRRAQECRYEFKKN